MDNNIYKKIELVGTSSTSYEDAVKGAVKKASETLRNLRWFEVLETTGMIEDGEISQWQVVVKVAFTLDQDLTAD